MTLTLKMQSRHGDIAQRVQRVFAAIVDQNESGAAILQHVAQTVLRIVGIERYIGGARLQDGVQGNHHIRAAVDAYRDAIVRL
ncbi:Uncharacterised protein [Serratia marcescens]|uniref:Uncharacterized protein n=1 Tax=Serratia marcescens TaxID=615 RepID=A0A379YEJ8_SERMA|nr:Uncharacterised protein [Serratia marcescens]